MPAGQHRCVRCKKLYSARDPHAVCHKCGPRLYSRKNPCPECSVLSVSAWDLQRPASIPYSARKKKALILVSGAESIAGRLNVSAVSAVGSNQPESHISSPLGLDVSLSNRVQNIQNTVYSVFCLSLPASPDEGAFGSRPICGASSPPR